MLGDTPDDWNLLRKGLEVSDLDRFRGLIVSFPETTAAIRSLDYRVDELARAVVIGCMGAIWLKSGRVGPVISSEPSTLLLMECFVNRSLQSSWRRSFIEQATQNLQRAGQLTDDQACIESATYKTLLGFVEESWLRTNHPTWYKYSRAGELNDQQAHQLFVRALAGIALRVQYQPA